MAQVSATRSHTTMKRTLLITAVTALLFLGQSPLAWAQVPDDDWDDDFDMTFEQDDDSTLNPINGFLELAYSRRLISRFRL